MIASALPPVALGWDSGRDVPKYGKKVFTAPIPTGSGKDPFWSLYHEHKDALKDLGYTVYKNPAGEYVLNFWILAGSAALPLRKLSDLRALVVGEAAEREARAVVVDLPELEPWIVRALRGYQIEHTQRLLRAQLNHRASLDSSQMGLGKTYCGVALAAQLRVKPYVVCPLAVVPTWEEVFRHFGVKGEVMGYEALRTRKGRAWLAVEPSARGGRGKAWRWTLPQDSLIIYDEAHRIASPTSLSSQIALAAVRQKYRIHVASGTVAEDPSDMRFLGALCRFHDGSGAGFQRWAKLYRTYPTPWGGLKFQGDATDLARLHSKLYPDFGSRLRVQDLPPGSLPENVMVLEPLEVEASTAREIAEAYRKADAEAERIRASQGAPSAKAASILAEMIKARQEAERLKRPVIVEEAKQRMREGYSVILGWAFREGMLETAKELGDPRNLIIGGQSQEERARVLANFQSGATNWIVVGIDAGGVGISLHDMGPQPRPRFVFVPLTFSASSFLQFLGRAPRNGAITPVHQKICMAAGTIEEEIRHSIARKVTRINTITAADLAAGLDFVPESA